MSETEVIDIPSEPCVIECPGSKSSDLAIEAIAIKYVRLKQAQHRFEQLEKSHGALKKRLEEFVAAGQKQGEECRILQAQITALADVCIPPGTSLEQAITSNFCGLQERIEELANPDSGTVQINEV